MDATDLHKRAADVYSSLEAWLLTQDRPQLALIVSLIGLQAVKSALFPRPYYPEARHLLFAIFPLRQFQRIGPTAVIPDLHAATYAVGAALLMIFAEIDSPQSERITMLEQAVAALDNEVPVDVRTAICTWLNSSFREALRTMTTAELDPSIISRMLRGEGHLEAIFAAMKSQKLQREISAGLAERSGGSRVIAKNYSDGSSTLVEPGMVRVSFQGKSSVAVLNNRLFIDKSRW